MIDHDHLQAALGGERQRLERGGAAIERDHQPAALRREALERLRVGAVALEQAIGHVDHGLALDRLQIAREQRHRGRAVDVVVAEQADRLAGDDRVGQPLDRAVEVVQMRRVGQRVAQPRRDEGRHAVEREAAAGQDPADHLGQLDALADRERQRGVVIAPAPAAAADRALDRRRRVIARARPQATKSGTTAALRCR